MREVRTRTSAAAVGAALVMTMTACGEDGGGESTSSSSGTASSPQTYSEGHILAEVKKVDKKLRAVGQGKTIPEDADWATDAFRKPYNDEVKSTKDAGAVVRGKITTESIRLASNDPDAPGGWDVSTYQCTKSTVRIYIDGKDVTADPEKPDKLLPKGPRVSAFRKSFTTPDDGKTWQIDDSVRLTGKDEEKARCSE